MDTVSAMITFARVVETNSFSEAARRLGLSKSAVSKQIARLEDKLGARLLNRTTRRISPTEVGAALFRQGFLTYRFGRAGELRAPVLIIGGTRDFQSVIELHREFVRTLPNGRLLEYEGNGHFMWVEDPQRFARDVSAFLDS